MKIFSNDQRVRNETLQGLKDLNSQSLSTQATKVEQLVSMMPTIKKAFDLLGDDIVDLSTDKDALKKRIGFYDEKWLEETEAKLLKQIADEKKASLIMSGMKNQMNKH